MKILKIFESVAKGVLYGLRTYSVLQLILLLGVILYFASWTKRIIVVLCLSVLYLAWRKLLSYFKSKVVLYQNENWKIKYKLDHAFIFSLPRRFFVGMTILSIVCFISATYVTWFVNEPPVGTFKECATVFNADNPEAFEALLIALPNSVSLPVVHLSVALDTFSKYGQQAIDGTLSNEQTVEIEQVISELEHAVERLQVYQILTIVLWPIYGLLNQPARIKNYVKR